MLLLAYFTACGALSGMFLTQATSSSTCLIELRTPRLQQKRGEKHRVLAPFQFEYLDYWSTGNSPLRLLMNPLCITRASCPSSRSGFELLFLSRFQDPGPLDR